MFDRVLAVVANAAKVQPAAVDDSSTPKAIRIHPDDLLSVCNELHHNTETYFDMLSCISGIDNGPEKATMEIAYNLYSMPYNIHLTLKVTLPRDKPEVESLTSIWRTANWHERETFDLFGIRFKNHPDLRRILLPADWEGFPLRKDYKTQDYYKGIKTDY